MGRPATTQLTKFIDGFYIEIRNRGAKSGMKIRRESKMAMIQAGKDYERNQDVVILGEYKDGKWLNEPQHQRKKS